MDLICVRGSQSRTAMQVGALRWLLAILSVLTLPNAAVAEERFRIDPEHTFVHFAVLHTEVSSVRGRIAVTKGNATLDRERQVAEFSVEISPGSVDTGVKKLDAVLIGEQFFDVGRYKTARFSGRATRFADGVPAQFEGELTLKGITAPVTLIAERFTCRQVTIMVIKRYVCGGDLTASVKRSDFGMSKYLSMVSDEVRLTISVEAIREGE